MSCFSPDYQKSSSSIPKKAWRGLISALQKKVNNFAKKSKSFNGSTTQYTSLSSYHRHCRYLINSEPSLISRVSLLVGSDDASAVSEGENGAAAEDLEDEDDGVIVSNDESSTVRVTLQGVDASAEEFIEKMKEYWKLERQKSVENYMETLSRFYEH